MHQMIEVALEHGFDDNYNGAQVGPDPDFPYPDGPGAVNANPRVLRVMIAVMRHFRVDSIRPRMDESMTSACNLFLWRLATVIFIRLI